MDFDIINEAKRVFDIEIEAIKQVRDSIDERFTNITKAVLNCKGKIIITGMGKPGHIGRKIAATMASLGTPSFFMHPAEALHGDLGMIEKRDIIIAISYSGESEEIIRIIPNIKAIGATIIGISGNIESTLIKYSDHYYVFPKFEEACHMNLAPTSSTTATLVYGDAMAVVLSKLYGFTENNFGLYHPAGSLGKKLFIKAKDIMNAGKDNAVVGEGSKLKKAIIEMANKGLGIVVIVNSDDSICGVITDGDLRRLINNEADIYNMDVNKVMSKRPITVYEDMLAVEVLQLLKNKNISCVPVVDNNKILKGTIKLQDILNIGILV